MTRPTNHDRSDLRKPRRPLGSTAASKRDFRSNIEEPVSLSSQARPFGKQRIAKVIARAGLCSRRDAETWIEKGRVTVNGVTLTSPAVNVDETDQIWVDGARLETRQPTRLFLFHKPRGCVTTAKDPQNRQTVFDILPKELPRLISVGRLDFNTQGLLLLTNDGGLARVLELPRTGWLRRYRVRANGKTDQAALDLLACGIIVGGTHYGPIEARLDRVQGANVWLTIGLREGKNREVKRVLETLGLIVNRLIRVSFGPFQLLDLAEGSVEEVSARVLKQQLGEAITLAAKADFEWPAAAPREQAQRPQASATIAMERSLDAEPRRRERPEKGKRKHISVLRAERRAAALLPQKIQREATADRRGRAIAVERLVKPSRFVAKREPLQLRSDKSERHGSAKDRIRLDLSSRPERAERARTSPEPSLGSKKRPKDRADRNTVAPFGASHPDRSKARDFAPRKTVERRAPAPDAAVWQRTKGQQLPTGKKTRPAHKMKPPGRQRKNRVDQSGRAPRGQPTARRRDRTPP